MEHFSDRLYSTFNRNANADNTNISIYNQIVDKLNVIESSYVIIYPTFLIEELIYIKEVGNKLFFGVNDNYKNYTEGTEILIKILRVFDQELYPGGTLY